MTFELKIFLIVCVAVVVIGKLYLSIENMILRAKQQKSVKRRGKTILRRFYIKERIRRKGGVSV